MAKKKFNFETLEELREYQKAYHKEYYKKNAERKKAYQKRYYHEKIKPLLEAAKTVAVENI